MGKRFNHLQVRLAVPVKGSIKIIDVINHRCYSIFKNVLFEFHYSLSDPLGPLPSPIGIHFFCTGHQYSPSGHFSSCSLMYTSILSKMFMFNSFCYHLIPFCSIHMINSFAVMPISPMFFFINCLTFLGFSRLIALPISINIFLSNIFPI